MAEPTAPQGQPQGQAPAQGAAPAGIPQPAMAAAQGQPGASPMMPPHVQAMMPRPYPNPQQMFQPVGMAAVMRMQMMQGQGNPQGQQQQ